jgi:hypothetical protein
MKGIVIDMKDGYNILPNSGGLEAGHNTDGFDISTSTDVRMHPLPLLDVS